MISFQCEELLLAPQLALKLDSCSFSKSGAVLLFPVECSKNLLTKTAERLCVFIIHANISSYLCLSVYQIFTIDVFCALAEKLLTKTYLYFVFLILSLEQEPLLTSNVFIKGLFSKHFETSDV